MKKQYSRVLVCVALLFFVIALTACANESEALQARIDTLEAENAELQSTLSSLRADLERAQAELTSTQNELQYVLTAQEEAEKQEEEGNQSGPLAITSYGNATVDFSWPLKNGDFTSLGVRVNLSELDEEDEIYWRSTDDGIFTVIANEDGLTAVLTPLTTGSAELVVTVGDQETRCWVRIT